MKQHVKEMAKVNKRNINKEEELKHEKEMAEGSKKKKKPWTHEEEKANRSKNRNTNEMNN